MTVLIACASKHGATAEIAERIGSTLHEAGVNARSVPISAAPDPTAFEAAIVGSAVYMGHWMKEAREFVGLHRQTLARRPLWLFSSGPVGPKSLPEAAEIAEFQQHLAIREHRTFDGSLEAKSLSLGERVLVKAVKAPYGDYRNWDDIDAWARLIAAALATAQVQRQPAAAAAAP